MNSPIYPLEHFGGLTLDAPLALSSGGTGSSTGDASGLTLAGQPLTISITATQIPALSIPMNAFRTLGYAAAGDGGDAIYIKGASSGPMATQDASGQWWVLAPTGEWSAKAWGAKGDGATDDTAALNAWLAALVAGGQSGYAPPGVYMHGGMTLNTSGGSGNAVAVRGAHPSQTVFRTKAGTTNPILTLVTSGGYGGQPQPVLRDFMLDGNNYNSGHGISISAASGGYGQGFLGINVTVLKPGIDNMYVGNNAGAGCLIRCDFAHPGRNVLTLDSGDWRMTDCDFMGAELAGNPVSGAINNGAGLARLTVAGHGMTTGQTCFVWGVDGATGTTGVWTVTVIDANTIDLQGSTFGGVYTFLGRCVPVFTVVGAVNNGAGLIRIQTSAAHGFATGAQVYLQNVGGVPNANGGWLITVIDATHFDLQGSQWGGAYTSGGTACSFTATIFIGSVHGAPASNQLIGCNIYSSMFGVMLTNPSGDGLQVVSGSIDSHWLNGINLQTWGMATPHTFAGPVRMGNNSGVASGQFADIYLSNTCAERLEIEHVDGDTQVSYLVATDGTCVGPVYWTGYYDPTAHPPFTQGPTTYSNDANLPYGKYAAVLFGTGNECNSYSGVGGTGNNVGGQGMLVVGHNNSSSGNNGSTFGMYGADGGEISMVWGANQFAATGDNQVRFVLTAGCVTTNTTPTRLLVALTASPTAHNTLNLFFNYQSMAYDRITIMCKNPATGDTKTWVVDNLVAKRGASASAITLNGSSSTINPSAVYTGDSALSACAVSLAPDTVNGGIAVTATGLAGVTLHWSLKASPLEVV